MKDYKYILEPYAGKDTRCECPKCQKNDRSFARYIDVDTGGCVHPIVGRCNHESSCGYHYTPNQYFTDNNIHFDKSISNVQRTTPIQKPQPVPSFIDSLLMKKTLTGYENNNLVQYLKGIVGDEATQEAVQRYLVGTSKHWEGATVFYQVDGKGRVHGGKIMQYNRQTGKRIKEPFDKITWVHSVLKLQDFHLQQCLFGEHLLMDQSKPVAIVESEKTAIIASCYFPSYVWLACGGCKNLSLKLCEPLRKRNVVLFPDANKFEEWNGKMEEISKICNVSISSLIEKQATGEERKNGFDLADYLVRYSPKDFIKKEEWERDKYYPAFVDVDGILYIPTPPDGERSYTKYSSVEAYNKRTELPCIIPISSKDVTGMKQALINLRTLQIERQEGQYVNNKK